MRLRLPLCLLLSTIASPTDEAHAADSRSGKLPTARGTLGPLLACGTHGDDDSANTQQVIDLFGFVKGVCVDQLGESYDDGYLPTTCETKGCQRAAELLGDSCASFFKSGFVASVFKPMLDPFSRKCAAAVAQQDIEGLAQRHAITSPASATASLHTVFNTGDSLTDGMGRGGHSSSSGLDEATVHAAPGHAVALVLRALWLPTAYHLSIYMDGSAVPAQQLVGHGLPPLATRTYRSQPGGSIRIKADASAADAQQPVFFSFRVLCTDDAGCNGHGACDEANGTCKCQPGWSGATCDKEFFPHSRIIVNGTWAIVLNRWVSEGEEEQRLRPEQQWALCYSSFVDNALSPSAFHSQCDQYRTTLVVARNSLGYTFGGYAVRSWSVDSCCTEEDNRCIDKGPPQPKSCSYNSAEANFIFRLSPGGAQQYPPRSSTMSRYQFLQNDAWPVWGVNDLNMGMDGGRIGSNGACCLKRGSYTCTPQKGELCGGGKAARDGNWGQTDMEVWRPL